MKFACEVPRTQSRISRRAARWPLTHQALRDTMRALGVASRCSRVDLLCAHCVELTANPEARCAAGRSSAARFCFSRMFDGGSFRVRSRTVDDSAGAQDSFMTAFTTLRSDSERQTGSRQCAVGWSACVRALGGDVRKAAIGVGRSRSAVRLGNTRDHHAAVGRLFELKFGKRRAPRYGLPRQMIGAGPGDGGRTH